MAKKIENLTEEQKAQLPIYRDKWIKVGTSTEPVAEEEIEAKVNQAYREADSEPPAVITWFESPNAGLYAAAIVQRAYEYIEVEGDKSAKSGYKLPGDWVLNYPTDPIAHTVAFEMINRAGQFYEAMAKSNDLPLLDNLRKQKNNGRAEQQAKDAVLSCVARAINEVGAEVDADNMETIKEELSFAGYGQHDAPWYAFYDYFRNVCGLVEETDKMQGLMGILSGWWWPFKHIAIMTRRPTELHTDSQLRLHRDGDAAIRWADGFNVYAMSGIAVPRWMACDAANEIDAQAVLNIQNVDQRREVIRRIGVTPLLEKLNPKTLDVQGDYELLSVKVFREEDQPWIYLKMKNPSVDLFHVEAVHPDCTTVQHALNYRAYGTLTSIWSPSQLT